MEEYPFNTCFLVFFSVITFAPAFSDRSCWAASLDSLLCSKCTRLDRRRRQSNLLQEYQTTGLLFVGLSSTPVYLNVVNLRMTVYLHGKTKIRVYKKVQWLLYCITFSRPMRPAETPTCLAYIHEDLCLFKLCDLRNHTILHMLAYTIRNKF